MKIYRIVLGLVLIAAFPVAEALAAPGRYAQPPAGHQVTGPGTVLKEGIARLSEYLQQGSRNDAALEQFLQNEVAPYFDFSYMARWVAGPRYRYMNTAQRDQLQAQLQSMFLGAMAQKLARYQHGYVRYLRPRANSRTGEVTLGIQAYQQNGLVTRLDFRLYHGAEGWKVFDVSANGQSALVYYRQQFNQTMQSPGYRGGPRYAG